MRRREREREEVLTSPSLNYQNVRSHKQLAINQKDQRARATMTYFNNPLQTKTTHNNYLKPPIILSFSQDFLTSSTLRGGGHHPYNEQLASEGEGDWWNFLMKR